MKPGFSSSSGDLISSGIRNDEVEDTSDMTMSDVLPIRPMSPRASPDCSDSGSERKYISPSHSEV